MKQYIVDAFTNEPFSGNPAAVCVMENWPSEESMMKLAMENNLSETAFIVKEPEGYHLRWFTPGTEVELCGHATLASSFVILNFYEPNSQSVQFNTMSGVLTVQRKGNLYEMDFPTYELKEIPITDAMEQAFGVRPVKAVLGLDLVCVFETVCGSAHCQISDYWSQELGKKQIYAYQASKRGGYLRCELQDGGRISISGEAALVAISEIVAELR